MNYIGSLGLGKIPGFQGFLVKIAQLLYGSYSKWTHVFVILDDETVLQAEPGGASIVPLATYLPPNAGRLLNIPLTDQQRKKVVEIARKMQGTPYSGLDYASLFLHRLHIRPKWVVDRVMSTGHMICSQLGDWILDLAGYHLFEDGRYAGDVVPGDISILADKNGW
jgi:hypothetical protein